MLSAREIDIVKHLIDDYRSGNFVLDRDREKLAHAIAIVRANTENPKLCSCVHVSEIEPGDAVCFLYKEPDVNEFWRFGIVDKFNSGCWLIYTLNIKKRG